MPMTSQSMFAHDLRMAGAVQKMQSETADAVINRVIDTEVSVPRARFGDTHSSVPVAIIPETRLYGRFEELEDRRTAFALQVD